MAGMKRAVLHGMQGVQPTATCPSPAATATSPRPAAYRRLRPQAPVSIARGLCLRLGSRHATCRDCVDACPTQALCAGEQALALAGDCTGCGRCQSACPTAALQVAGFPGLDAVPPPVPTLRVDCLRAGAAARGAQTLSVPCLGGLSVADWLTLSAQADGAAVIGVDRGWCAACPSGGREHPARAALAQAAALMGEAGVPAAALPRLQIVAQSGHSHGARTPAAVPGIDPMAVPGRARRGFLAAMARPVSHQPMSPAVTPASARRRLLAPLRALAARHGGRLPASLFHQLQTGDGCRSHRVCAAACPTGALVRFRDDARGRLGIAFDSADCTGCGHCVAACPEQALQLHSGRGRVDGGLVPLVTAVQRECTRCGARFAGPGSDAQLLCPQCRKSAHLAGSAFQTLFGAGPHGGGRTVFSKEL